MAKKSKTLLVKAKEIKVETKFQPSKSKRVYSKEEVDLAVAWARSEIALVQVSKALNYSRFHPSTYVFLAKALSQHIRQLSLE